MSAGLILTAKKLICDDPNGQLPTEYDCRRAVSTAYYSLFHFIADRAVHQLAFNSSPEFQKRVHRSIDHNRIESYCNFLTNQAQPADQKIFTFAGMFKTLKEQRHTADYDFYSMSPSKQEAQIAISSAESATVLFSQATQIGRSDFVVGIMTKARD